MARSLSRGQGNAYSLRHVMPFVAHKLRTVHEMRDTQCQNLCKRTVLVQLVTTKFLSVLKNFVVTSRDTLEITWKYFLAFQNFCHDMARTTSPDPHRHASPRTLSRVLLSSEHKITKSCQCEACFNVDCAPCVLTCTEVKQWVSSRYCECYAFFDRFEPSTAPKDSKFASSAVYIGRVVRIYKDVSGVH